MHVEESEKVQTKNDLSIIVVSYNTVELAEKCLSHIRSSKDKLKKEVIFVDNGSKDGTAALVKKEFPEVKLIESPTNLGFVKANNLAIEQATGKYILMLNSDAFLGENTLEILTNFIDKTDNCGVVGPRTKNGDGNYLPSARYFPTPWRLFLTRMGLADRNTIWQDINCMKQSHEEIKECDWVSGCCLLIRKSLVDEMGVFLRPELFMYNDDNDLCMRVKKLGWKVYFHPETITHLAGATSKKVVSLESKDRTARLRIESEYIYFRKNYGLLLVLVHYFLTILFDGIQILKRLILFKKHISLKSYVNHIIFSTELLWKTGFGRTSAHLVDQK